MSERRYGIDLPDYVAERTRTESIAERAMAAKSNNMLLSRLETIPAELRIEVFKNLLPTRPIRLDHGDHLSRADFVTNHLHLLTLPHEGLNEEYVYEYFRHTPFVVRKQHNVRNMPLETGLVLLREANVNRIRMLTVHLDDWLTVELAFKGTSG